MRETVDHLRVETSDGCIACEERGAGPPLLLRHSLGSSRHAWSGVSSLLSSSRWVIAAHVLGFLDGIPGARMAIVEEAGHVAQVANSEAVARLVREFLSTTAPATETSVPA